MFSPPNDSAFLRRLRTIWMTHLLSPLATALPLTESLDRWWLAQSWVADSTTSRRFTSSSRDHRGAQVEAGRDQKVVDDVGRLPRLDRQQLDELVADAGVEISAPITEQLGITENRRKRSGDVIGGGCEEIILALT